MISMFNLQKLCLTLYWILIQSPDSVSLQATYLNLFFNIIFPNVYRLTILPVPLMFPTTALYVFLAAQHMANIWTNLHVSQQIVLGKTVLRKYLYIREMCRGISRNTCPETST